MKRVAAMFDLGECNNKMKWIYIDIIDVLILVQSSCTPNKCVKLLMSLLILLKA